MDDWGLLNDIHWPELQPFATPQRATQRVERRAPCDPSLARARCAERGRAPRKPPSWRYREATKQTRKTAGRSPEHSTEEGASTASSTARPSTTHDVRRWREPGVRSARRPRARPPATLGETSRRACRGARDSFLLLHLSGQ